MEQTHTAQLICLCSINDIVAQHGKHDVLLTKCAESGLDKFRQDGF